MTSKPNDIEQEKDPLEALESMLRDTDQLLRNADRGTDYYGQLFAFRERLDRAINRVTPEWQRDRIGRLLASLEPDYIGLRERYIERRRTNAEIVRERGEHKIGFHLKRRPDGRIPGKK